MQLEKGLICEYNHSSYSICCIVYTCSVNPNFDCGIIQMSEVTELQLEPNDEGRDFIIGDLHGCFDILQSKLNEVDFDKTKDRLFSVGDIIDRGPDSEKCLELLYESWFFATIGNHELMFLTYMGEYYSSIQSSSDFLRNGGNWISQVPRSLQEEYMNVIKKTMHGIIRVGDSNGFVVTHSELVNENYLDVFVWNRDIYMKITEPVVKDDDNRMYCGFYDNTKPIVYVGHNTLKEKQIFVSNAQVKNHLMLDLGAYRNGNLSFVEHKQVINELKEIYSES